ncbi:CbtB-domain containing protein [Kaistia geumhonensis]|uniref:Cobalt transporter subunit CbtB n=1 Tax=Kaistia geumhonensis TaxID=410839 RepID=A0ABU0M132_9HYPH|nr:CbtB domain-containing protein [Kaistia geumhonensis]MCX5480112.1 CbtB-domain containing protein [Kaistia geumhonensis]MDQ0514659.1 cobalt transporter subunit CbtB [Kaistia geumhonensis]
MAASTLSPALRPGSSAPAHSTRIIAGAVALAFGLCLFLATGFAAPSLIHNATHDTRHAFGLPCH